MVGPGVMFCEGWMGLVNNRGYRKNSGDEKQQTDQWHVHIYVGGG